MIPKYLKLSKRFVLFLAVMLGFVGVTFLINLITFGFLFYQKPDIDVFSLQNGEQVKIHTVNLLVSNAYILENGDSTIIIDAGMPYTGSILNSYLSRNVNKELKLIVITHAHLDHYGGANRVKDYTKAPIAVHSLDSQSISMGNTRLGTIKNWMYISKWVIPYTEQFINVQPTPPDIIFTGGENLGDYSFDNVYILHTPGHTPGSISIIVGDKIAFVGDLVSARGEGAVQKTYANSWEDLYISLENLNSMPIEYFYTGHGSTYLLKDEFKTLLLNEGYTY